MAAAGIDTSGGHLLCQADARRNRSFAAVVWYPQKAAESAAVGTALHPLRDGVRDSRVGQTTLAERLGD